MKKIIKWLKSFIKPKAPIRKNIPYNVQPYIVRVKNTSKESKDVTLFGAIEGLTYAANDVGVSIDWLITADSMYGVDGGVFIDCPIPTTSYKDILWSSMLKPFVVEYTQVYCDEEDALKHITLNTRDALGNTVRCLFMPNPSQNQVHKNIKEFNEEFSVNGFTSLTFNMPSESTMIYYFFEKK